MASRVVILRDEVNAIVTSIKTLANKEVLIGIPEAKASRQQVKGNSITNPELGYIHEFGAPAANIPARPFLIPGVQKATAQALEYLRGAALAMLDGKPAVALNQLKSAGRLAESSVKQELRTAAYVPLKPATVAERYRNRDTQTRRSNEVRYLQLVGWGTGKPGQMTPLDAQNATGIRPLINSGELLRSITSVVRSIKR